METNFSAQAPPTMWVSIISECNGNCGAQNEVVTEDAPAVIRSIIPFIFRNYTVEQKTLINQLRLMSHAICV